MQKYNAVACALVIFALAPCCLAITTDRATAFGEPYVLSAATETLRLAPYTSTTPLLVNGDKYWVLYYYSTADNPGTYLHSYSKIVVADAGNGSIALNADVLSKIFTLDYEYAWETNYVKPRKLSYSDLSTGIETARQYLQTAEKNILTARDSALSGKTDEALSDYFDSLVEMIDGSDGLIATLDDLKDQEVDNARQSGSFFSTTGDVDSYLDYMANYNATFAKCAAFSQKAEAFFEKVTDRDAYSKLSSDETSVLQKVTSAGLGTDAFYSYRQYTEEIIPGYDNFKRLESGQVNDSAENTRFRIAKADAVKAYATVKDSINNMFSEYRTSKAAYDRCGVSTKVRELNATWLSVTSVMEMKAAPLTSDYQAAYLSIQQSAQKYSAIVDGMTTCGTTTTPKPQSGSPSSTDLAILAVLAVLAVYGFLQYRKWQKKRQEEEEG
jgi:type II secretory pathway pseudopilin PulG